MPLYINEPRYQTKLFRKKNGVKWCQMIGDDETELKEMGKKLKLRFKQFSLWNGIPHYDLAPFQRELALKEGVIPLGQADFERKVLTLVDDNLR